MTQNDSIQLTQNDAVRLQPAKAKSLPQKKSDRLTVADSVFFGLKESTDDHFEIKLDIKNTGVNAQKDFANDTIVSVCADNRALTYVERGKSALHNDSSWLLIVLFISLIISGIIKMRAPHFIPSLLSSIISDQSLKNISVSQSLNNLLPTYLCKIIYFVSLSALLYEIIIVSDLMPVFNIRGVFLYGLIIACILIYTLLKYIINVIIGFTFNAQNKLSQINNYESISQCIIGIIVIPIALLFPFANESHHSFLIYGTLAFIIAIYLWRLLKSTKIVFNFYVFLYLCTVEGAPLLCIYKAASLLTN